MAKNFVILPAGTAMYPHLSAPDMVGEYADGKYKTKVVVDKAKAADAIAIIEALAKDKGVSQLPFKDDKEDASKVVFNCKSKFAPIIFAADGKTRIKPVEGFAIGSGSTIRCMCELFVYKTGVSLQLKQVQLIHLVEYESSAFDAVEGGTFDGSDFTGTAAAEDTFGETDGPDI